MTYKYPCETVKDLLPLYHDKVCSEASKKIVEEHLLECEDCKSEMKSIDDDTYDNRLQTETENVVGYYTKKVKRKSLLAGLCISGVLSIPILVCLIVNLATGHALDWFFIVLASLTVFASITVVPLVVEGKKGLMTIGSITASLMLLFLVCCLYSGGDWFFIASVSTLFGLSVVFLPYVLKQLPLKGIASKSKGLITMGVDSALLYAVVIIGGFYGNTTFDYWLPALLTTTANVLFVWLLFVVIRYLKVNRFTRAGISIIICGIFVSLIHDITMLIQEGIAHITFMDANLWMWSGYDAINANIYLLILLSGCVVGTVLLVIGLIRSVKKKRI